MGAFESWSMDVWRLWVLLSSDGFRRARLQFTIHSARNVEIAWDFRRW